MDGRDPALYSGGGHGEGGGAEEAGEPFGAAGGAGGLWVCDERPGEFEIQRRCAWWEIGSAAFRQFGDGLERARFAGGFIAEAGAAGWKFRDFGDGRFVEV